MTITRLWTQKHPKCFDPENDILLLDFQLEKTEATELLRQYFEEWEDDDYNRKDIEVIGGTYPHFDMWDDVIRETADKLDIDIDWDDEDACSYHALLGEMSALQHWIEAQVEKSGGELFVEVE